VGFFAALENARLEAMLVHLPLRVVPPLQGAPAAIVVVSPWSAPYTVTSTIAGRQN